MSGEYSAAVVDELTRRVADNLPRWGLSCASELTLLNLSENATFAVCESASQRKLIVRVHRVGYSSAQQICSELAWIQALRDSHTVETAAPLPGVDGQLLQTLESLTGDASRFAVAFEHLPGTHPDEQASQGEVAQWFERLGELTARMHQHARAWRLPADFQRRHWDLEGTVGPGAPFGCWQSAIGLDAEGKTILQRAVVHIQQRLQRFGMESARYGLIHGDLRLANLLVDGSRLRIIDFDDCGFGWFLYDFATAVSFFEEQPMLPALLDAWLRGYENVTALSAAQRAEIPTFVVLRRIVLAGWLASHHEVPFAKQFGVAHTRDTVRLAQQWLKGSFLRTSEKIK